MTMAEDPAERLARLKMRLAVAEARLNDRRNLADDGIDDLLRTVSEELDAATGLDEPRDLDAIERRLGELGDRLGLED